MRWRPDRSSVLLLLASSATGWWGLLELLGKHPDSGLLGVAAPLWAAWATSDRDVRRRKSRRKRKTIGGDHNRVKGPEDAE